MSESQFFEACFIYLFWLTSHRRC